MKASVVIVAGGSGSRMKSDIPKQFLLLKGKPILMHTIERFYRFMGSTRIILVLPSAEIARWDMLCKEYNFSIPHLTTTGGDTRFHSVKNGLELAGSCDIVAIHDGVRPLVSNEVLDRCFKAAFNGSSVVPVIPAVDSLRMVTESGNVALDRSAVRLVQTPQVFPLDIIQKAYSQEFTPAFTDDASVAEASGEKITLVEGNVENIKITNPLDLTIAERVFDSIVSEK